MDLFNCTSRPFYILMFLLALFQNVWTFATAFSLGGKVKIPLKMPLQAAQLNSNKPTRKRVDIIGQGTNLGFFTPVAGSDYLGIGYDIFEGNPDGTPSSSVDPGFRKGILDIEFNQLMEGHRAPTHGYLYVENACQYSSSISKTKSSTDYEKELDKQSTMEVKVNLLIVKARYKKSKKSKEIRNIFTSNDYTRYYTRSFCLKYRLGLYLSNVAHIKVLSRFNHFVQELPKLQSNDGELSSDEKDIWYAFFKEFGTHYLNEIHLGGKMMQEAILTKDVERETLKKQKETKHEFSIQLGFGKGGKGGKGSKYNPNKRYPLPGPLEKDNTWDPPQTGPCGMCIKVCLAQSEGNSNALQCRAGQCKRDCDQSLYVGGNRPIDGGDAYDTAPCSSFSNDPYNCFFNEKKEPRLFHGKLCSMRKLNEQLGSGGQCYKSEFASATESAYYDEMGKWTKDDKNEPCVSFRNRYLSCEYNHLNRRRKYDGVPCIFQHEGGKEDAENMQKSHEDKKKGDCVEFVDLEPNLESHPMTKEEIEEMEEEDDEEEPKESHDDQRHDACEHVCFLDTGTNDMCYGTFSNPIPVGEDWLLVEPKVTDKGCCMGARDACNLCCPRKDTRRRRLFHSETSVPFLRLRHRRRRLQSKRSGLFWGIKASGSFTKNEGTSETSSTAASNSCIRAAYLGGEPSEDVSVVDNGDSEFEKWASTVDSNPMPVKYKLSGFDTLQVMDKKKETYRYMLREYSAMIEQGIHAVLSSRGDGPLLSVLQPGERKCSTPGLSTDMKGKCSIGMNKPQPKSSLEVGVDSSRKYLTIHGDGSLRIANSYGGDSDLVWTNGVKKEDAMYCMEYRKDNNFVVYHIDDSSKKPVWQTLTNYKSDKPAFVRLDDDGAVEIWGYDNNQKLQLHWFAMGGSPVRGYLLENAKEECVDTVVGFGDRFMQLGDWRFGDVDGQHFSMAHKDGKTAQIYRSDGTLHSGPRGDFNVNSRRLENKNAPGISVGDRFIQIGKWRICDIDGTHASICTIEGKTAQIFRNDGTLHPGPRTDYCCNERPIDTTHENAPKVGDRYIQIGQWRFGDIDGTHASASWNKKTAQIWRSDGTLHPGPRDAWHCQGFDNKLCGKKEAKCTFKSLMGTPSSKTDVNLRQQVSLSKAKKIEISLSLRVECICQNGVALAGKSCHRDRTEICSSCNKEFYMEKNPDTGTSVCKPFVECTCQNGVALAGKSCRPGKTEICSTCNQEYYYHNDHNTGKITCKPYSTCYCNNGVAQAGKSCFPSSRHRCERCTKSGYKVNTRKMCVLPIDDFASCVKSKMSGSTNKYRALSCCDKWKCGYGNAAKSTGCTKEWKSWCRDNN